jgi:hypothetical protein
MECGSSYMYCFLVRVEYEAGGLLMGININIVQTACRFMLQGKLRATTIQILGLISNVFIFTALSKNSPDVNKVV